MSKTVDDRVVQMEFDNSKFENNVKTSLSTLEKLKAALNFEGSVKGTKDVTSGMSGLGGAADTVRSKFSALEIMGITALSNITNSAVNSAKQLLSSFTIDPVTDGFKEYELKMDSIKVIMASTGESLETVNQYLAELNKYSDDTIYSFSDMTNSIGKFTNAGVNLDQAVAAIKGISNEAAVSGANAQEASRAMYNFAQALSAGYVKLIDWKSIENANMATVEFKTQLLEAAVAAGTVEKTADNMYKVLSTNANGGSMDSAIDATHNFNDSLSYQWMTTEVLVNTLNEYADATTEIGAKATKAATEVKTWTQLLDTLREAAGSGWADTWQLVIGDYNQSKELFTMLSDTFGAIISYSADYRNNILKNVFGNSGWDELKNRILAAGVSMDVFESKSMEVAKNHGIDLEKMINEQGSFEATLSKGWMTSSIFSEILGSLMLNVEGTTESMEEAANAVSSYADIVNRVILGEFGNGADRVAALTEAGYDYAAVQKLVNDVCAGGTITQQELAVAMNDMSDAELESIGLTAEQIEGLRQLRLEAMDSGSELSSLIELATRPSGRELMIDTLRNALEGLRRILNTFHGAWDQVFPSANISNSLYNFLKSINDLSKGFLLNLHQQRELRFAFMGLFSAIDIVRQIAGAPLRIAFEVLKGVTQALNINILDTVGSIGELIYKFRSWLTENDFINRGISLISSTLTKAIVAVIDFVKAFAGMPGVQIKFRGFKNFVTSGLTTLYELFSAGSSKFSEFIDRLKSIDDFNLENIKKAFIDFKDNVLGYFLNSNDKKVPIFDKFSEFANRFKGTIASLKNGTVSISDIFGNMYHSVLDFINGISESVGSKFESIIGHFVEFKNTVFSIIDSVKQKIGKHGGNILAMGIDASLIAFLATAVISLQKIMHPLGTVASWFSDIAEKYMDVLKIEAKAKKLNAISSVIRSVALAVIALAASFYIVVEAMTKLQEIDSEKISDNLVNLGIIAAGLLATGVILGKFSGGASALGIIAAAAAFLIIVEALKHLELVEIDTSLIENIAVIIGILTALSLVAVAITRFSGGGSVGSAVGTAIVILALTLSLYEIVKLLDKISDMPLDNVKAGLERLTAIIVALGVLMLASSRVGVGAGISAILLTVAIRMFINLFDEIMSVDMEVVRAHLDGFKFVLGMLAGLLLAASIGGKKAGAGGVGLLAMTAAIAMLLVSVKMASHLSKSEITKGTAVVGLLTLFIDTLILCSSKAGKESLKAGVMILAFSASMLILVGVIALIGLLSDESIKKGLITLGLLTVFIDSMILCSSKAGGSIATLILLDVAIVMLTGCVIALSFLEPESLITATACIAALMGMFALLMGMSSLAKGAIVTIVALDLSIALLTACLYVLANNCDPDSVLKVSIGLGVALLALSASLLILSAVGAAAEFALMGIGTLDLLIANFAVIALALGALVTYFPDLQTFLDTGIPLLVDIGTGMGEFIGGFVGGIGEGVTDALPGIAENFEKFCTTISGIDSTALDGAKNMASIITALSAASLINSVSNFISILGGTSLNDFVLDVYRASSPLKKFIENVSGLSSDAISKANAAARIIETIAGASINMPSEGGLLSGIFGSTSIEDFGDQMTSLGDSVVSYCNAISELSQENVDKSELLTDIVSGLADVASDLPNSGGWLGAIVGDNDIDNFGDMMEGLGDSVVSYTDSISDITDKHVTSSAYVCDIVSGLAEAADNIPNSGGWLGDILGENDIDTFGVMMEGLGTSVVSYANAIDGINQNAVDNTEIVCSIVEGLAKAANAIPNEGGKWGEFWGENGIDTFSKKLPITATYIKAFALNINGMPATTTSNVAKFTSIMTAIADTYDSLGDNASGISEMFNSEDGIMSILSNLPSAGTSLKDFATEISGLSFTEIESAVEAIGNVASTYGSISETTNFSFSSMLDGLSSIAQSSISGIANDFQNGSSEIANAASDMMKNAATAFEESGRDIGKSITNVLDSALSSIDEKMSGFKTAGHSLASNIANGISSGAALVNYRVYSLVSSAASSAKNGTAYGMFYQAGEYMVRGFVNGIEFNTYLADQAARSMAESSANAAKKALNEHSPSKVMYDIGMNGGKGFVNGLLALVSKSSDAGKQISDTAIRSMGDSINRVADILFDGADYSPVITPVMDLTNVERGRMEIDSMLSNSIAGSINTAGSIKTMFDETPFEFGTGDILGALRDLKNTLAGMEANNYTINGLTYDDGSNITEAVKTIVRAARVGGRI